MPTDFVTKCVCGNRVQTKMMALVLHNTLYTFEFPTWLYIINFKRSICTPWLFAQSRHALQKQLLPGRLCCLKLSQLLHCSNWGLPVPCKSNQCLFKPIFKFMCRHVISINYCCWRAVHPSNCISFGKKMTSSFFSIERLHLSRHEKNLAVHHNNSPAMDGFVELRWKCWLSFCYVIWRWKSA